ncbi:MAG TPA: hypothetical protein EYQ60_00275 [Myxococcales bacterium]|nr:hypothetical protein [Myxococcales bacterium]
MKQSDRTMTDLAMALGISRKVDRGVVRLSEEAGDSSFEDERNALRRPRKELRELRMGKTWQKRRPSCQGKVGAQANRSAGA